MEIIRILKTISIQGDISMRGVTICLIASVLMVFITGCLAPEEQICQYVTPGDRLIRCGDEIVEKHRIDVPDTRQPVHPVLLFNQTLGSQSLNLMKDTRLKGRNFAAKILQVSWGRSQLKQYLGS